MLYTLSHMYPSQQQARSDQHGNANMLSQQALSEGLHSLGLAVTEKDVTALTLLLSGNIKSSTCIDLQVFASAVTDNGRIQVCNIYIYIYYIIT
jgi:hypothetical protein